LSRRNPNIGEARSLVERALSALHASDVNVALDALDQATALLRPPVAAPYGPVIVVAPVVAPAPTEEPAPVVAPAPPPAPKAPPAKKARR
jgi:hypothetical protein